jgi:2-polyprenyl-6-methoxyphenol hydroxylase-like FAD-dependent oxidoreductase
VSRPVSSTRPVGRVEADLLVACDGVHSVVRRTLYPDEGPPRWNGITMWRALTVGEPFLSGPTMMMAGHFRRGMVIYPISKRYEDQGRALTNWAQSSIRPTTSPCPGRTGSTPLASRTCSSRSSRDVRPPAG